MCTQKRLTHVNRMSTSLAGCTKKRFVKHVWSIDLDSSCKGTTINDLEVGLEEIEKENAT